MSDFIPSQDPQALLWMQTFAAGITASPATYALTAPDATAITNAVTAFDTALGIATDPATRTVVTINIKDEARASAEQICRQYAALIKPNAGISNGAKLAIGVPPVNTTREPINVPDTSPLLSILAATPGVQTVRYSDSSTPDSKAKPFGAAQIQIFRVVADTPTVDADEALFYGAFTKNPIGVQFAQEDDGKMATYFARWADRKGQVGPWSLPVSMRIAA